MRSEKRLRRRAIVPALGVVLGLAAGTATVSWSPASAGPASVEPAGVFDATHLPPLLRVSSEPVELAYDVHCAPPGDDVADAGCDVGGSIFARRVGDASFTELPLELHARDGLRQLAAQVPDALARPTRGFEYFAEIEAAGLGERLVLPAGGPTAPHVSRPIEDSVRIDLGRHEFRRDRRSGVRVAAASWGDGPIDVGLEQGRHLSPVGASAFDVDSRGNVLILDQTHRRLLRWSRGARTPARVPVSVDGTLADLAVAEDGSLFVLETAAAPGRQARVRRFDDGGRELEAIEVGERTPSQIRIDAGVPVVLGGASHRWLPLVVDGVPATADEQLVRGRPGRRSAGGAEVVVFRHENEVRVALLAGRSVVRSWRVTSDTSLAEVQLAEPRGNRLVLVVRVYDERDGDEFAVLVLGPDGIEDRFSLDPADWAETAPFARFRFVGRSLYRFGSTPSGAFVDRFDLEVR
jgi:hypothetical protein